MKFSFSIQRRYGFVANLLLGSFHFRFQIQRDIHSVSTIGIRNTIPTTPFHVIFLDYDCVMLENLEEELRWLQQKYKLSDFIILESSQKNGSYHAICLDYVTPREWGKIIRETNIDENYATLPINQDFRSWVLRVFPKGSSVAPKLLKVISSKYNSRKKSLAHALFFKYHHRLDYYVSTLKNLDKNTKLMFLNYKTMSFIEAEAK